MIVAKTEHIKGRMARKGYTGVELAKAVGITQGYVAQVLSGKKTIRATTAKKICEVLHSNFDDIFDVK